MKLRRRIQTANRTQFRFSLTLPLLALGVTAAGLLTGCRNDTLPVASAASLSSQTSVPVTNTHSTRFTEVAQKAGIRYRWEAPGKRPLNILQTIGNGCAFLDYDGDKNQDILLVGPRPALYRGDGKGNFTDVTSITGLAKITGHFIGCAVGDYDNDGWREIYLSGYRTGVLLHNNGGVSFTDVTKSLGLKPQPWGTSCGFADMDRDGYLDLYIANYADFGPSTTPQMCKFATEKHGDVLSSCGPRYYKGIKGVLFQNQAGKRFSDVTKKWGLESHHGRGLGVAFADVMDDGHTGIAIANDEAPGDLFMAKESGKTQISFENTSVAAGVAYDRDGSLHGGMGVDWGDFNNDGRPDLFVATFRNEAKSLYRNDGEGTFTDVSYPTGIGRLALPYVSFGTKFLDADNDGWLDLLVANGHVQDNIELIENTQYRQKTMLLQNEGGQSFTDATAASGMNAFAAIVGRGLAVGDYDNDGRMDALVVDSEGVPLLLHNETPPPPGMNANWVGFVCLDAAGRDAYGATLTVEQEGAPARMVRQCQTAGSYLSSSDPRVHFGLGSKPAERISRITVRWPDGRTDNWKNVPTGRYWRLQPGKFPD